MLGLHQERHPVLKKKKKSLLYIQMLIHYGDRLENNGAELKVPSSVHLIVWKLQKFSACFLIVFCFLAL